jgi:hypothetical protein
MPRYAYILSATKGDVLVKDENGETFAVASTLEEALVKRDEYDALRNLPDLSDRVHPER